jgi:hypothetical protein
MKLRDLRLPALAMLMVCVAGCATNNGVPATAPGYGDDLVGSAEEGGQYNLYRATGTDHADVLTYEKLWSVNAQKGEKLGFRWVTDQSHRWDNSGAFHLVAFAAGDSRDLGPVVIRDAKYVWASANTDLDGYFHHLDRQRAFKAATLQ